MSVGSIMTTSYDLPGPYDMLENPRASLFSMAFLSENGYRKIKREPLRMCVLQELAKSDITLYKKEG